METLPRSYRKDALIVFILLTFFFAFFYQDGESNGNSRFGLIFASLQEGSLSIDHYYNQVPTKTVDHSFYNGHYYSDKAIGPMIIGAILYAPLSLAQQLFHHPSQETVKVILTFLGIGLPSAIAGSLMYILCLYLSRSRLRSYLVTLAITLGTLYLPYSVTFFSHQLTSSLLFSAFFLIFFLKENREKTKNGYLFLIGLLLGLAFICEYPSAVIILALVIYYIFSMWKNTSSRNFRSVIFPLLGGLIPLCLQLAYNRICFGSFFSVGYSNLDNQYFGSSMSQGVMGIQWPSLSVLYYMTLHPAMGIFWESPVLLLAVFGAIQIFRQKRYQAEAILAIGIIVSYLIFISGYFMWWGGYALGPRHLIPILPFFCILLVFVPRRCNWPLVGLGLLSMGQMLIGAASTVQVPDTMVSQFGQMGYFAYSNVYSFCLPQLIKGNFTQNLGHRLLHLNSWSSLLPLFVFFALVTMIFFWNEIKSVRGTNVVRAK
jgi:hypothetical protein